MKENGFLGFKEGSFEEGLARFNTKGGLIQPVRINKRMKEILFEMIINSKNNTVDMGDYEFNEFMTAMDWLENKINKLDKYRIIPTKKIGWKLFCWMNDHKYYHLSDEPDFEKALQWVTNHINKYYAQSQLGI